MLEGVGDVRTVEFGDFVASPCDRIECVELHTDLLGQDAQFEGATRDHPTGHHVVERGALAVVLFALSEEPATYEFLVRLLVFWEVEIGRVLTGELDGFASEPLRLVDASRIAVGDGIPAVLGFRFFAQWGGEISEVPKGNEFAAVIRGEVGQGTSDCVGHQVIFVSYNDNAIVLDAHEVAEADPCTAFLDGTTDDTVAELAAFNVFAVGGESLFTVSEDTGKPRNTLTGFAPDHLDLAPDPHVEHLTGGGRDKDGGASGQGRVDGPCVEGSGGCLLTAGRAEDGDATGVATELFEDQFVPPVPVEPRESDLGEGFDVVGKAHATGLVAHFPPAILSDAGQFDCSRIAYVPLATVFFDV